MWFVALFFICRRTDAGACQIFAQMFDFLFSAYAAVVWMMQHAFDIIQYHAKARAMAGLQIGAQVMQQRFYFPPMDVTAKRILEYGAQ